MDGDVAGLTLLGAQLLVPLHTRKGAPLPITNTQTRVNLQVTGRAKGHGHGKLSGKLTGRLRPYPKAVAHCAEYVSRFVAGSDGDVVVPGSALVGAVLRGYQHKIGSLGQVGTEDGLSP